MSQRLAAALLLLLCTANGDAAAAKPARRKVERRNGPTTKSIEERGLLDPYIIAADLAEGAHEYHNATWQRRFSGDVLGYVTPWCAAVVERQR